jgi:peptidoglycan/LPS O-acetylase OafA/YrhL
MSFLTLRVGRPEGTKLAGRPAADRARVAGSPSDAVDTSSSKARIRGVEGFRALAASSIILYHTWLYSSPSDPVALGPFSRFVFPHRGLILTYRGSVQYETLTAIASMLLLALVVLPSADGSVSHLTRLLDIRFLVAIGLASYSMFLWHEPLIRWLQSEGLTFAGRIGFVENLALVCALTAVLATLTYRFVERPALAQKRR